MNELETRDLILGKAVFSDWQNMYRNVWSQAESARYMQWRVTESEAEAQARIQRTIAFEKTHDTWLVYRKADGSAIGFAGVEKTLEDTCSETGICLGPQFVRQGYGTQILQCLMAYGRIHYGAKTFLYTARSTNEASKHLALSQGFQYLRFLERTDERSGRKYTDLIYSRAL